LAALLFAQIEIHKEIQTKRNRIYACYASGLESWARRLSATLPTIPEHCSTSYHLFHILLPDALLQRRLLAHLTAAGINAVFHYQPLHLSPMGTRFGGKEGQCPVSETVAAQIVRLPFFYGLSEAEQDRVIDAVQSFSP
jgi:dTDP-4-amino-4,6-dideoxygalactose transaminase